MQNAATFLLHTSRHNLSIHRTWNGGCLWKYSLDIHLHIVCYGGQMKRSHFLLHARIRNAMQCTKFLSRCNARWFISGCLYATNVEWNQQPKDCYDARVIALNCSCWAVQPAFVLRLTFADENIFSLLFRVCTVCAETANENERIGKEPPWNETSTLSIGAISIIFFFQCVITVYWRGYFAIALRTDAIL